MNMTDAQEKAIISEVLSGEHEQFRFLVERYHRGLVTHLYNLINDQASAEDVAQEAFIRAYDKLSQYNETYAFSTWLYKIADNIAYRQLKHINRTTDFDDIKELVADDKPSLDEVTDKVFAREAVKKSIETLPVMYRQVIALYYWDNFNYEEIAIIMERPVGTIRTWLHRAKEDLRKELYGQV
jgi:RNA polymerase sigma-70 factor, ECF subfamily